MHTITLSVLQSNKQNTSLLETDYKHGSTVCNHVNLSLGDVNMLEGDCIICRLWESSPKQKALVLVTPWRLKIFKRTS